MDDNTMKTLDFENRITWRDFSEEIMLCDRESFEVSEGKLHELANWKKNEIFTQAYNEGQEKISIKWLLSEKTQGVSTIKARLVTQGFEDMKINFIRKGP